MKRIIYIGLISLLICCSDKTKDNAISIGDYSFNFPNNFKLVKEQGIDSYVGHIKGDNVSLDFDYGNYSNRLVQSTQEYLDEEIWLLDAATQFMKVGVTYDINNFPKVEVISSRRATLADKRKFARADVIAICKHDSLIFDFPIKLPEEIKEHIVKIDTIQDHFRKIVIAKDPKKGLTGIYLKRINSPHDSTANYSALSIATGNLTKMQQDLIVKIFSTARFIDPK
jgi:hypothetical protein